MATGISILGRVRERVWWPWLLVGIAWTVAVLATVTGQRALIDHHFLLEESGLPWPLAAAVFLACWQVMIVAMMVPVSMPVVTKALAESRYATHPHRALGVFFAGYACVWTAFGLLAFTGDTLIHHLVDAWPWLAAHAFLIGATTFGIAGLFQFSRWKIACLTRCRRQAIFAGAGTADSRPAWQLGIRHGGASVGCCWALMLVMFGVGVGGLGWMAGLTGAMLGETILPGNRRASQVVGIALFLLAGLWLAHPAWIVPVTVS